MKKSIITLFLTLSIFASSAFSQYVVFSGKLKDAYTGEGISNASVTMFACYQTSPTTCTNEYRVAITNGFGNFQFDPVFNAQYFATMSKKGYVPQANLVTLYDNQYIEYELVPSE